MVEFRKIGLDELYKIQKIAYETWPNTFGQVLPKEQIDYMLHNSIATSNIWNSNWFFFAINLKNERKY